MGKKKIMPNKKYTIFKENGACKCVLSGPTQIKSSRSLRKEFIIPGDHRGKIVFVNEKSQAVSLHDTPESSIKMIQDEKGVLLENLENPTRIVITGNGESFHRTITDGAYQFLIDTPGNYVIKCESDVELPIEFKVKI